MPTNDPTPRRLTDRWQKRKLPPLKGPPSMKPGSTPGKRPPNPRG